MFRGRVKGGVRWEENRGRGGRKNREEGGVRWEGKKGEGERWKGRKREGGDKKGGGGYQGTCMPICNTVTTQTHTHVPMTNIVKKASIVR